MSQCVFYDLKKLNYFRRTTPPASSLPYLLGDTSLLEGQDFFEVDTKPWTTVRLQRDVEAPELAVLDQGENLVRRNSPALCDLRRCHCRRAHLLFCGADDLLGVSTSTSPGPYLAGEVLRPPLAGRTTGGLAPHKGRESSLGVPTIEPFPG